MVNLNEYCKEHKKEAELFATAILFTWVGFKIGKSDWRKRTVEVGKLAAEMSYHKGFYDGYAQTRDTAMALAKVKGE